MKFYIKNYPYSSILLTIYYLFFKYVEFNKFLKEKKNNYIEK